MDDLQRRITETSHALQDLAVDITHTAKHPRAASIAASLEANIAMLDYVRDQLISQQREAAKLADLQH